MYCYAVIKLGLLAFTLNVAYTEVMQLTLRECDWFLIAIRNLVYY